MGDISSQITMFVSSMHKDVRKWQPIRKEDACGGRPIKAKRQRVQKAALGSTQPR